MNLVISDQDVRDYLELNSPGSASKYTTATIGSNILAAQSTLEKATHRFFADHSEFLTTPWAATTLLRAQVAIPAFRSFTTVTWGGTTQTVGLPGATSGASCWAIPDAQQTGVYTALQFRAWRVDNDGPWWLADRLWWDKMLDSPFFPGNWGGGYAYTSMPLDLQISGAAGYAAGTEPPAFLHAVKVLASFYTMRPASILADVAITPQGGVLNYSQLPAEVRDFVAGWAAGEQAVSVG